MPSNTNNTCNRNSQKLTDITVPTYNLIRLPQVRRLTTLSVSEIYRRMDAHTFPRRVLLGPKTAVWLESEILEWVAKRVSDRDCESVRKITWGFIQQIEKKFLIRETGIAAMEISVQMTRRNSFRKKSSPYDGKPRFIATSLPWKMPTPICQQG